MRLKILLPLLLLVFYCTYSIHSFAKSGKDLYEIKIYHIHDGKQASRLDHYLENAFIPAMHRYGIKNIGVFKPVPTDSLYGKRIIVFSPYADMEEMTTVSEKLFNDSVFLKAGSDYLEAGLENAPYDRIETILLEAFDGMPHFRVPQLNGQKDKRIYELRSYESSTELLFHNKVSMFNEGEIEIFDNLGFNAVFYGKVLAGAKMPNLMYMTTFENMASEKEKWKNFGEDPDWIKMRDMEEYQGNVSHIDITLLFPTHYSDI